MDLGFGALFGRKETPDAAVDVTPLGDGLLAVGKPWESRTERKARRNNLDELGDMLESEHAGRYLVLNLSYSSRHAKRFDFHRLQYQVLECDTEHNFGLETLFRLCHAARHWLGLDERNRIAFFCTSGIYGSRLFAATFLVFALRFESTHEALEHFYRKRLGEKLDAMSILAHTQPSVRRVLDQAQSVLSGEPRELDKPATLHMILIDNLPGTTEDTLIESKFFSLFGPSKEDLERAVQPIVRVYVCGVNSKRLLFCSQAQRESTLHWCPREGKYVLKCETALVGDVEVECVFAGNTGKCIFRYSFHTAFLGDSGVFSAPGPQVDTNYRDQIGDDFKLSLVMQPVAEEVRKSLRVPTWPMASYLTREENKDLALHTLVDLHVLNPDPKLCERLVQQGHGELEAQFALLRTNNSLGEAARLLGDPVLPATLQVVLPEDATTAPSPKEKAAKKQPLRVLNLDSPESPEVLPPMLMPKARSPLHTAEALAKRHKSQAFLSQMQGYLDQVELPASQVAGAATDCTTPSLAPASAPTSPQAAPPVEIEAAPKKVREPKEAPGHRADAHETPSPAQATTGGKKQEPPGIKKPGPRKEAPAPVPAPKPMKQELQAKKEQAPSATAAGCQKFVRMLRMGVPPGAVSTKMRLEGLDPSLIGLSESASVPARGCSSGADAAPRQRRKKIHWEAIPADRVKNNSIWAISRSVARFKSRKDRRGSLSSACSSACSSPDSALQSPSTVMQDEHDPDMKELEALFAQKHDEEKSSKPKANLARKASRVNLLNARRSQNVSIALRKLRLPSPEICRALREFDSTVLDTDKLQVIQQTNMLPSEEEEKKVVSFRGDPEMLAEAERFFFDLRDVHEPEVRLAAMGFRATFASQLSELRQQVVLVERACAEVRASEALQKLFQVVLLVGNKVNAADPQLRVDGFTVASLLKLSQTKSFNRTTTMLDFVAAFALKRAPGVFKVRDELATLAEAKRIQFSTLAAEESALHAGYGAVLRAIKLVEKEAGGKAPSTNAGLESLRSFSCEVQTDLEALGRGIERCKADYASLLEYFCEDPELGMHDFFSTLDIFLRGFQSAAAAQEEKAKREARRRKSRLDRKKSLTLPPGGLSRDALRGLRDAENKPGTSNNSVK